MEPILTIDNLNSFGGNMLRQGDKSQLKYKLRDVGNKNLGISGKSCQVKMYGRNYTTVVYETTATVSTENTVSFTIDKVLPKGTFYLEFTVGDYIFPTDHREFFEITPSGKGADANIIEIVGKDVLIQEVKSQVDAELQPLVTSLESAEQAETQRVSEEASRASAEAQRVIDHANRSAELDSKADKVVIKNELVNGGFTSQVSPWIASLADFVWSADFVEVTPTSRHGGLTQQRLTDEYGDKVLYVYGMINAKTHRVNLLSNSNPGATSAFHSGNGNWESLSFIHKQETDVTRLRIEVRDDTPSPIEKFQVKYVGVIDLTAVFGAGNEPSKEEMDRLIEITGYIDGEYTFNNKEMLGYLTKGIGEKANKKQEDWITPTLLNGATGTVQYRKNEFNELVFKGEVKTENAGLQVFIMPLGYRPTSTVYCPVVGAGLNDIGKLTIGGLGGCFLNTSTATFNLGSISMALD